VLLESFPMNGHVNKKSGLGQYCFLGVTFRYITLHGGHHFLYIESPARLIHPYARHDFRSWFGQKTAQMNHAPFSTHHDVMTWRDFDATEQCDVARMDDVGISQCIATVAFNCTGSMSERRPDKLPEKIIWSYFDSWIMHGSVATHKK
jgi:hypothetical protein